MWKIKNKNKQLTTTVVLSLIEAVGVFMKDIIMTQPEVSDIKDHLVRIDDKLDRLINGDPNNIQDIGVRGCISDLKRRADAQDIRADKYDKSILSHKKMFWGIAAAIITGVGSLGAAITQWLMKG